jgi:hypothetical protein
MKTLSYYKNRAKLIALQDKKSGFKFHVNLRPFSKSIDELCGKVLADGYNLNDMNAVEKVWENNL